jgi:hypothetical protein
MKILFCPSCYDVIRLIEREWRLCDCGLSGGQYNKDGMTATLGGIARVFGVANPFFNDMWLSLDDLQRQKYRESHGYGPADCWWGEYKGDIQIFKIEAAEGPRLRVKVKNLNKKENEVSIIDNRPYSIDGKKLKSVVVPTNTIPSFKGHRIPYWVRYIRKQKCQS